VPTKIRITVRRENNLVVAAAIDGLFGQVTLYRRELEHLLAALRPDLLYDEQTIRLKGHAGCAE
jgi:hypothetical protein